VQRTGDLITPAEPVGGPDALNLPPQALQDLLSQAVAVARRRRTVIRRAVALDPQQVSPRILRIHHCQIDRETGASDLCMHRPAAITQRPAYLGLER